MCGDNDPLKSHRLSNKIPSASLGKSFFELFVREANAIPRIIQAIAIAIFCLQETYVEDTTLQIAEVDEWSWN